MYNPVLFEMISGSIAAERVAVATQRRTANALATGSATGWSARRLLQPMLVRGLRTLRGCASGQQRGGRPPTMRVRSNSPSTGTG
jgi:hypothetical protein